MARDLNSKRECLPKLAITFGTPARHDGPLSYYTITEGREVYYQLLQLVQGDFDTEEELEAGEHVGDALTQPVVSQRGITGQLRVIEGAAVETEGAGRPVVVMALDLPDTGHYWFWTTRTASPIITSLTTDGHMAHNATFTRANDRTGHGQLYMMIWVTFDQAVALPDSAEYLRAEELISADDITPEAPEHGLSILQQNNYISRRPVVRSLDDDRYADLLQEWEIYLAERADVTAAEYLEVRRLYFNRYTGAVAAFRSEHDLDADTPRRRFENWKNKVDFLTALRNWVWGRRRVLVGGWDLLGMLDEHKF